VAATILGLVHQQVQLEQQTVIEATMIINVTVMRIQEETWGATRKIATTTLTHVGRTVSFPGEQCLCNPVIQWRTGPLMETQVPMKISLRGDNFLWGSNR
jgi:hypothetical protein